MTTGTDGPEQRIAIWSLSARVIGAYFVIFLIQYVPSMAFEAYSRLSQRTADETFVHAAVEVVKACGPIGIGAATNALAIAMMVEMVMVLAKILSEYQRAAGIQEGFQKGFQDERKAGAQEEERQDSRAGEEVRDSRGRVAHQGRGRIEPGNHGKIAITQWMGLKLITPILTFPRQGGRDF